MTSRRGQWAGAAAIVAGLGLAFDELRLPASWLIAGMLGAAIVALLQRRESSPPVRAMLTAQGIVGVVAAEPLTKLSPSNLVGFAGVAVFSIGVTLALSMALGSALARLARDVSLPTAKLSLIAGGASTIASMARELGADQRYVALSQYLRLTIVVITLPMVLSQLGAVEVGSASATGAYFNLVGLLVLAAMIMVGGRLAGMIHLPAPYLLGPMLISAALAMAWPGLVTVMDPPALIVNLAYVVIGWQAGGGFSVAAVRTFAKLLPITLAFIAVTIASCFVVAVVVSQWAGVSLADAYLATTPGGIYGVLAAASKIGSGPIVITLQVLRMVTMVLVAAMIPKFIRWSDDVRHRRGSLTGRTPEGRSAMWAKAGFTHERAFQPLG
jgi:uncharacterized protein